MYHTQFLASLGNVECKESETTFNFKTILDSILELLCLLLILLWGQRSAVLIHFGLYFTACFCIIVVIVDIVVIVASAFLQRISVLTLCVCVCVCACVCFCV